MIKKVPLFPYLFVLYLVLNPLFLNLDQVEPGHAFRPLAVLLAVTALSMLLVWLACKDWHYAGYLVFLGLWFQFGFGHLYRILQGWWPTLQEAHRLALMAAWGLILGLLGLRRQWLRFGGGAKVTPLLNLFQVLALVSIVITSFPDLAQAARSTLAPGQQSEPPTSESPVELDCSNRPDIYYIILDGYGRADVLEELYGVDTTPFLESLQRKGFYIADQSHTNYTQTIYSLSASLNFNYIPPEPEGSNSRPYFTSLIAGNQLMKALKECGYQTVTFETGFSFTDNKEADLYLYNETGLNEFESLLVAGAPLEQLFERFDFEPPEYSYPAHSRRILFTFEQLRKLPSKPGPKFIFAHILAPHPPFLFDAGGRQTQPGRDYSIGDGDDFKGNWQEYREGYREQVQFVNKMLEQTVDAILSGSRTPPIIILQGDHGPGGHLEWGSPSHTCLWERTSIFNAYYLPRSAALGSAALGSAALGSAALLYPDISPVNTFRVVLDAYFDAGLDLLPDQTHFTSHRLPRQVIDITDPRDSRVNCP
jgi:hypothetical protein